MTAPLEHYEIDDLADRFIACGGRSFGIEFRQFIERPDHFERLFASQQFAAWKVTSAAAAPARMAQGSSVPQFQ